MGRLTSCLVVLIALILFAPFGESQANHRHEKRKHTENSLESTLGGLRNHGRKDHGNEATGQIALWLLAAANLTVIISLVVKGVNHYLPIGNDAKISLNQINNVQKKYLSRLHYFFNPIILGIAILHWSLSRCNSTALPELGLTFMIIVAGLGILLKFRMTPQKLRRALYRIHTHPGVMGLIALLLLAGHLAVD